MFKKICSFLVPIQLVFLQSTLSSTTLLVYYVLSIRLVLYFIGMLYDLLVCFSNNVQLYMTEMK